MFLVKIIHKLFISGRIEIYYQCKPFKYCSLFSYQKPKYLKAPLNLCNILHSNNFATYISTRADGNSCRRHQGREVCERELFFYVVCATIYMLQVKGVPHPECIICSRAECSVAFFSRSAKRMHREIKKQRSHRVETKARSKFTSRVFAAAHLF